MDEADRWPVKFWDIDAAMASMLMLLAAVEEGLGGWFFGITHGERALLDHLGVPGRMRPIGILGSRLPGRRRATDRVMAEPRTSTLYTTRSIANAW